MTKKFPEDPNWWKEEYSKVGSIRSLAKELNTTRKTVRKYLRMFGLVEENDCKHLISELASLKKRLETEKQKSRIIAEIAEKIVRQKFKGFKVPIPKLDVAKTDLQMFILRGDSHIGLVVNPDFVQGISKYDFDEYKKRLNRLIAKIYSFWEEDRKFLSLRKAKILYLGDIIENECGVYPSQPFSIDLPVVEQIFEGIREEIRFVFSMARLFEEVEVFCVFGNHGRVHKYSHPKSNWDYVFYKILKLSLEHQENVKVFISKGPSLIFKAGRFNIYMAHGNAVKSWSGIPFYGLERVVRRLSSLYDLPIHYAIFGHFHQPINVGDFYFVNGTMVGGTDLSINRLMLSNVPSQKIIYFDERHGFNRETNIYLEDPVKLKTDEHNIYTPTE